jgi:hypothetical protein
VFNDKEVTQESDRQGQQDAQQSDENVEKLNQKNAAVKSDVIRHREKEEVKNKINDDWRITSQTDCNV